MGVLDEHARDVQCDVSCTDHGDRSRLQRPLLRDIRVAGVPRDEVGSAERPRQIDPRDVKRRIADRAGRDDDGVVSIAQFIDSEVGSDLDVAEQADVGAIEDDVQRFDDLLDTRVVTCNAVADQTVGCGQFLEQIDMRVRRESGEEVGGVDSSWTCADDGDT